MWKKQIKKYCKIQSPWPIGVSHDYFMVDNENNTIAVA
jgi:hypothetical protein